MVTGGEAGMLVRRLRRRQGFSQRQLAERVLRVSGDRRVNPHRVAAWENGKEVPDEYWCGWIAMALGMPHGVLDRVAAIARVRRRSVRRVQTSAGVVAAAQGESHVPRRVSKAPAPND